MSKKNRDKAAFPKKVGGVKVPKHLRRAGAKLLVTAASPIGLELIAAGLSLAAAAVAKERAKQRGAVPVGNEVVSDGGSARIARVGNDPHEIGIALGRMAEVALAGLVKRRG